MGRLLAFVLGGLAIALWGPLLVMSFTDSGQLRDYKQWWIDNVLGGGETGAERWELIFQYGPGIFAGLALLLLALRGKE